LFFLSFCFAHVFLDAAMRGLKIGVAVSRDRVLVLHPSLNSKRSEINRPFGYERIHSGFHFVRPQLFTL